MALVDVVNLEKAFTGRSVLKGLSFDLQKGQKIGLVGPNGCGKTTLLKILAGVEHADHGSVTIAKTCKVAYVSQIPRLDPEETLHHQVSLVFDELHDIERQMHEAADLIGKHPSGPEHDAAMEKYGHLEEHFNHMGGYDIQRKVESVLDQLGFSTEDLDRKVGTLSGGQKSRAQIAQLLLEGPDLMLLDEPTNHLDLGMLDWLENTLNQMPDTTLVVVSHDRYFLDSVVTEIYDVTGGLLEKFPGNYTTYTELKTERQNAQEHAYTQQQGYIAKQEEYIRRFGAGVRAMQARGRKTRLERLKDESLIGKVNRNSKNVILNLKVQKASGHDVLKADQLTKNYPGKKLWDDVHLDLQRGKRLGIIGPNGSGKTTLLNVFFGEAEPDSGHFKWGYGVVTKYFRQEHQDLILENTIIDELQRVRITATQQELRDLAALFLFSGDTIEKKLAVLSGGERSRVAMAKLILQPTNTILMDEPTNHLDLQTCEVLEEALDSYDGTLILVSHDRYFMDQVCDQLLALKGDGTWKLYKGSYTDYLAAIAKEKSDAENAKRDGDKAAKKAEHDRAAADRARQQKSKTPSLSEGKSQKPKPSGKFAKITLADIERQIAETERNIQSLEGSFGNPKVAANPAAMKELRAKYDAAKSTLADLMAAWESKGT
jgi:ATP-binding cassette subfamily F protein 3